MDLGELKNIVRYNKNKKAKTFVELELRFMHAVTHKTHTLFCVGGESGSGDGDGGGCACSFVF